MSSAAKIPRMAITTNNSLKVNPFSTINRELAHGAPNASGFSGGVQPGPLQAVEIRCSDPVLHGAPNASGFSGGVQPGPLQAAEIRCSDPVLQCCREAILPVRGQPIPFQHECDRAPSPPQRSCAHVLKLVRCIKQLYS